MSYNYITIPFAYGDDTLETKWENGVVIGTLPVTGTVKAVQYNHRFSSGNSAARIAAYKTDDSIGYAFLYAYPADISTTTARVEFINEVDNAPNIIISTNEKTSYSAMFSLASCTISYSFMDGMETDFYIHETRQEAWKAVRGLYPPEHVDPEDPSTYSGVVVQVVGKLVDDMDEGGTSTTQPPTGDFDDNSDPIGEPAIPLIGAQNSGMITLFRPSLEQVYNLGSYIYTHIDDFIQNLQKWLTDPSGYIISFHIVPCAPSVGEVRNINIGNFATTITMPPCVSQWYTFDFGVARISPYSGTYLDYAPYTKIQLFLPFIGSVQLNTDEVMNSLLGIKYHIDLLSGQCVALISVNGSYLYQFTGECSVPIPLTGNDWSRVYAAAVGAVGTFASGAMAFGGGGLNPMRVGMANASARSLEAAANAGSAFTSIERVKGAPAMREKMSQVAEIAIANARNASRAEMLGAQQVKASKIANTIISTVSSVMGAKQYVAHSGSITGSAGMLGIKKPFVIIEYPNQSLAENYKHFVGYPSNISGKLSEFTGYTECEQVIPNSFSGTDEELAQVLELLKEGVYL